MLLIVNPAKFSPAITLTQADRFAGGFAGGVYLLGS